MTDLEKKVGEMELSLAGAVSIILARDKKVIDLKMTLEESENKFYDMGFANAENSCEPIMLQTQRYDSGKGGWQPWPLLVCSKSHRSEILTRFLTSSPLLLQFKTLQTPMKKTLRA